MHSNDTGTTPLDRWHRVLPHRDRLLRIARTRTPSADDAEDVVQEAMLRCATFEGLDEDRLGQLLTSVTVRLCVDEQRRCARTARLVQRLPFDRLEEPGADEPVCARAEAEWASRVISRLTPMQQAILTARANGLSYDEISRRHRLTYKSVESSVSRARAVVRGALAATLAFLGIARRPAFPVLVATAAGIAVVTGVATTPPVRVERITMTPGRGSDLRPPARSQRDVVTARPPGAAAYRVAGRANAVRHVPRTSPTPIVKVGRTKVGPNDRDDDFTTLERVRHCVQHGVEVSPTIGCRYPDKKPR